MKNIIILLSIISIVSIKCTKENRIQNLPSFNNERGVVAPSSTTYSGTRLLEPVILTDTQLSSFILNSPGDIVGFRYDAGKWIQIPIQIDEMAILDITKPYGEPASGYNILMYTDANWRTGADPNPLIDSDDELVFMLKDAGDQFTGSGYPMGVIASIKKEVVVNDGLTNSYVYLFQQDGSLQQGAGINYVQYQYSPTNTVFDYGSKLNVENSFITTSKYKWHFAGEWISDRLVLNNVDILDRHKAFFGDGSCTRSENTFSDGSNAFVTNKAGAIRVIRSYMGANSGPYTQRTNIFYEGRQDILTDLRVHSIEGIQDVFDYSPAAKGMNYTNSLNSTPITIDGIKETVVKGNIQWELVSGSVGSLVILHRKNTTFVGSETTFSSYWDDAKTEAASKCTGDGQAWGTSGIATGFNSSSLFTEPIKGSQTYTSPNFRLLKAIRTVYFEAPNASNSVAINYNANRPLTISINYKK